MRSRKGGLVLGAVLLATAQALPQEDPEARLKAAQQAARANEASPEGREWKRQNSFAIDRLMVLVLHRCLPDPPEDETPTPFAVYLRLSKAGRAQEIVTELDASLGTCMTTAARELPFPEPPRDEYWIQLNLAAPL